MSVAVEKIILIYSIWCIAINVKHYLNYLAEAGKMLVVTGMKSTSSTEAYEANIIEALQEAIQKFYPAFY